MPPSYTYSSMTIALNSVGTQAVGPFIDPDLLTASASISTTSGLPISLSSGIITVAPVAFALVGGPHIVVVTLTDECGLSSSTSFGVICTNTPPYFTITNYLDVIAPMNSTTSIITKEFLDNEGHYIYLDLLEYQTLSGPLLATAPSFATVVPVVGGAKYQINFFINTFALLGKHRI